MATHDYIISNASGAAVRADLNNALAAIATNNSSATEPTTTYAYQWWADTGSSPTVMKLRNAANSGWITLFQLDGEWTVVPFENGTAAAPSIYFKDSGTDTGIYSPGTDQVAITTGGTGRLFVTSSGSVGIGISSPGNLLHVESSFSGTLAKIKNNAGSTAADTALEIESSTTAAKTFLVKNAGTERFYVKGDGISYFNGSVGIGTTSPNAKLTITETANANAIVIRNADTNGSNLQFGINTAIPAAYIQSTKDGSGTAQPLAFYGATSEMARFDTSGRFLVGTSSARANFFNSTVTAATQIEGTTGDTASLAIIADRSGAPSRLILASSGGSTIGSNTVVASGNGAGSISFQASDGTEFVQLAEITADVDGTPGANDMPGRLVFSTTADGASSPTERVRIMSNGDITFGNGLTNAATALSNTVGIGFEVNNGCGFFSRSGAAAGFFNRKASDGDVISIIQDGVQEGSISVSGTTTSYNGAHLSRWSQILGIDPYDKTVRPEILRGTVMSNLDEMCEWIVPESGDVQANEQLNKTKISDVEGDKNVAGVFQDWDDDDDTWVNDYYCAMTGDFIIRIAQGVTVERGDLLMSAGDGTAKPQDDDIIRSKTIAKVTSTNVSCTYDDGSYCVPCVLMAC